MVDGIPVTWIFSGIPIASNLNTDGKLSANSNFIEEGKLAIKSIFDGISNLETNSILVGISSATIFISLGKLNFPASIFIEDGILIASTFILSGISLNTCISGNSGATILISDGIPMSVISTSKEGSSRESCKESKPFPLAAPAGQETFISQLTVGGLPQSTGIVGGDPKSTVIGGIIGGIITIGGITGGVTVIGGIVGGVIFISGIVIGVIFISGILTGVIDITDGMFTGVIDITDGIFTGVIDTIDGIIPNGVKDTLEGTIPNGVKETFEGTIPKGVNDTVDGIIPKGVNDIFDGKDNGVIDIDDGKGGSKIITLGIDIGPIGPISKHGNTIGGKFTTYDGRTKLG